MVQPRAGNIRTSPHPKRSGRPLESELDGNGWRAPPGGRMVLVVSPTKPIIDSRGDVRMSRVKITYCGS
jgi:hypothetical protein